MLFVKYRSIGFFIIIFLVLAGQAKAGPVPGDQPFQAQMSFKKNPLIVFLITEDPDNYRAHETIPVFAHMLEEKHGYKTRVLLGKGFHGACEFPGIDILSKADLLVVFARRVAIPYDQMKVIKDYLQKGKPVIGIRTANHAFTVLSKIENGHEDWPEFVSDILGCINRGYGPVLPGTDVSVVPEQTGHPVLKNLSSCGWHSKGNIYRVKPLLDSNAVILLKGRVDDISEPVAWTRVASKSKVFYTSLGYPDDFRISQFTTLLVDAIAWALKKN